jgi:hypothetical protein
MKKVEGQDLQYAGETLLMCTVSGSVQLQIACNLGKGKIIVPVVASSTAKK